MKSTPWRLRVDWGAAPIQVLDIESWEGGSQGVGFVVPSPLGAERPTHLTCLFEPRLFDSPLIVSCMCFLTDNRVSAVWKIRGLVGLRRPIIWNASRAGNVHFYTCLLLDNVNAFGSARARTVGPSSRCCPDFPDPGKKRGKFPSALESGFCSVGTAMISGHKNPKRRAETRSIDNAAFLLNTKVPARWGRPL